ncbi:MAG: flagellar biosynthetic protein FliO [Simkaniaceae bacterium]|jgi:flagellar biogenesis protein FliO
MRYFKLFLILCCLPLLGEDTKPPEDPKKEVPCPVDQKKDVTPATQEEHPLDVHKATESYETAFIKTIVVLVGLLVLILLTVWMFKKISKGRFRSFNYLKSVKILEKRPLSPKSMLYLIEVGGKQVLIAESQFEVRTVATLDWVDGDNKDL